MVGHVARDVGGADPARIELRGLDIDGPDFGPFGVAQHRQVDRAGDVILGELRGAAHVDDEIEAGAGLRDPGIEGISLMAAMADPDYMVSAQSRSGRT